MCELKERRFQIESEEVLVEWMGRGRGIKKKMCECSEGDGEVLETSVACEESS